MAGSERGCEEEQPEEKLDLRTVNADMEINTPAQIQSGRKQMFSKQQILGEGLVTFPHTHL